MLSEKAKHVRLKPLDTSRYLPDVLWVLREVPEAEFPAIGYREKIYFTKGNEKLTWSLRTGILASRFSLLSILHSSWRMDDNSGEGLKRFDESIDSPLKVGTGQVQAVWNSSQIYENPLPNHDPNDAVGSYTETVTVF
jgi:hypothetical protein